MALSTDEVPILEGWITLSEAADRFGVSKQMVHKMVAHQDLKGVRRVGSKAVFVVPEDEVQRVQDERAKAAQERAARAEQQAEQVPVAV